MSLLTLSGVLWVVFFVYWVIAARGTKAETYRQPAWIRVVAFGGMTLGGLMIYLPQLSVGWLGLHLFPSGIVTGLVGLGALGAGLLFAVWARRVLGVNWSAAVTLKEGHELIRSGPYRIVRHPIYSGVLLGILGTAVVLGELRGFLAWVFLVFGIVRKIRDEEAALMRQFPAEYPEYRRHTRALIPWVV